MTSSCFVVDTNLTSAQNDVKCNDAKPNISKDKFMSYEEKSVGTTPFFKCEACPYMALAEDDIKFHLFTFHPELAKINGLADNIQIPCPGCASVFDAEETLRIHLRSHHKMGIKDIRKMIKSLVRIALSNVKLKKEIAPLEAPKQDVTDVKVPKIIEIAPDTAPPVPNGQLPTGVTYISMNELQKMSPTSYDKIAPKDIQEASINIVYDNNYVMGNNTNIQETNPPDLITSVQQRPLVTDGSAKMDVTEESLKDIKIPKKTGEACKISGCYVRLDTQDKLHYHRSCHRNGKLQCFQCHAEFLGVERLHIHLWREHNVDLELPTCPICGYKTYKRSRLINVHMKKHFDEKNYACAECSKHFKNSHQLSKHRLIHKKKVKCEKCHVEFSTERSLKSHISTVHEKLRPFKCSECEFSAARKEDLKVHLRLHTGAKPYSCDLCQFRCSDHNSMRRHKKKHSQENVYKCNYCPYKCIQSNLFASHMLSKHPDNNENLHLCPYCKYKSINKGKYIHHLSTVHGDINGVHLLIERINNIDNDTKAHSWSIPSVSEDSTNSSEKNSEGDKIEVSIILDDCDSQQDNMSEKYNGDREQDMMTDVSKDDCTISESSNDTTIDRQYTQPELTMNYDSSNYLSPPVPLDQNMLQCQNNLTSINTSLADNVNLIGHFPIRLPLAPQIIRKKVTLNPLCGPIIKPTQILPVPSSSNSPVNFTEPDGVPRKKPNISVKSNLILKGPDPINMFDAQHMKQIQDNDSFDPFNNMIPTQYMQHSTEPVLSESPNNLMPYCQDAMLPSTTNPTLSNNNIFSFNTAMNNAINLMPQDKNVTDPSYIKLESTIKHNNQSPSLERMCNVAMINDHQYKASPPLEDIGKNMGEIKNEVKFYNLSMNNNAQMNIDTYLIDNILEQYTGHLDMSNVVMVEQMPNLDHRQDDVIDVDDNSDDHKLLPRFDANYPLDSLYLMNNDFHFLDNDIQAPTDLSSETGRSEENENNFIHDADDPMLNMPLARHANKINVKNIELMKN